MSNIKARPFEFFNVETHEVKYGIQVRVAPRKWLPCAKNGSPILFDTEQERDEEIKRIEREVAA